MYYNEWENIIRDRLRNYNIWTARVNTLEAQIREIAGQLRLEAAPKTTKFGYDSFGGGWDKPSPEEVAYQQKEFLESRLQRLKAEYQKKKAVLKALDDHMDALEGAERQMIRLRGINHQQWKQIALDTCHDESWCRRKFRDGLRKMTGMEYGPKAAPTQTRLNLVEL